MSQACDTQKKELYEWQQPQSQHPVWHFSHLDCDWPTSVSILSLHGKCAWSSQTYVTATNTGNHSRACWTSCYLKCILQTVFSLKPIWSATGFTRQNMGHTHQPLTRCGWEAGRAQLGTVSLHQSLAEASSLFKVNGRVNFPCDPMSHLSKSL